MTIFCCLETIPADSSALAAVKQPQKHSPQPPLKHLDDWPPHHEQQLLHDELRRTGLESGELGRGILSGY